MMSWEELEKFFASFSTANLFNLKVRPVDFHDNDYGLSWVTIRVTMEVPHRVTGEMSQVSLDRLLRPVRDLPELIRATQVVLQEMFVHEFWEQVRFDGHMIKDLHETDRA